HLSNDLVSDFILEGMDRALGTLLLGHLSEHNNHPEIARLSASQALGRCGAPARLIVAEPRQQSEVFRF
ncbi:MAG: MBL fold metallo-hydrolase, partial [Acidobacteria bacterium]|nr:MBL fold metallo-hydrolase [Acidobacteriota bacterium]